jgi:FAD/FMN-containing dehydrogenase
MPHDVKSTGVTLRRGDLEYERARRSSSFNANTPPRYPDEIVQANSADDVVTAVKRAKAKGWKVGVKSGGHSWAANHLRDGGMMLDVSRLNSVEIDKRDLRASVGPGVKGHEADAALAQQKLFFPAGHCRGVCLGGYLLQGGFGWNSRVYGPACENVLGIDYVDADGEMRHASETENTEMLWVARGAGPGFFGVVTRFHLKVYPRPKFIGAKFAAYSVRHLDALVRWADQVGPDVPNSVELMMLMSNHTQFVRGPGIMLTAPVFSDSYAQASRDIAFMKARPRGASFVTPLLPTRLSWLYGGVMQHYPQDHNYAVDNMWTHAGAEDLLPGLRRVAESLPPAPSHMLWMNWAPPAQRPDMAFSLEDRTYIALYGVWSGSDNGAQNWAQDNMAAMAHLSSGMQLADENLGRRPMPFLARTNMAQLDALRAKHDPQGRFHTYMGRTDA